MNRQEGADVSLQADAVRQPIRILRWQVVLLGGVIVVVATAAVIAWLLTDVGNDPALRLEAVKTGFTVGFGLGGSLALVLAARRQWLQERAQAHQEEVAAINQAHQDRVAAAAEHDASERRITELYVKAVEQLGSAKAPVRLGGLHALERLAQANPDHRQTISDVICAYLRMPFTPPEEPAVQVDSSSPTTDSCGEGAAHTEKEQPSREELQVRLTAQRILASHLRDEPHAGAVSRMETFWAEIDLIDLTGAHLVDFALPHCRVGTLQLNGATLAGESVFRGMSCSLALIQGATFTGSADFRGAIFTNDAWFAHSTFDGEVWFHADEFYPGARFEHHASFKGVTFGREARFNHASFASSADFSEIKKIVAPRVRLDDVQVNNTDAELIWPNGWTIESNKDGYSSILTQVTDQPPSRATSTP